MRCLGHLGFIYRFFLIFRITWLNIPAAFAAGLEIAAVKCNGDVEKRPHVARCAPGALVCPIRTLTAQEPNVVLHDCVHTVERDHCSGPTDRRAADDRAATYNRYRACCALAHRAWRRLNSVAVSSSA